VSVDKRRYYEGTRLPKKVGVLEVHIGQGDVAKLDLRLDARTGKFLVVLEGEIYDSTERSELYEHVQKVLVSSRNLTWTRYLRVNYSAHVEHGGHHGRTWCGLDTRISSRSRSADGVHLHYEVVDISDPISTPGYQHSRRKERTVHKFGVSGEKWTSLTLPVGIISWTEERQAVLDRLLEMIGKLDAEMVRLFVGTPEELGARLDDPGARLLAPKIES
jgi:hypothetical protein